MAFPVGGGHANNTGGHWRTLGHGAKPGPRRTAREKFQRGRGGSGRPAGRGAGHTPSAARRPSSACDGETLCGVAPDDVTCISGGMLRGGRGEAVPSWTRAADLDAAKTVTVGRFDGRQETRAEPNAASVMSTRSASAGYGAGAKRIERSPARNDGDGFCSGIDRDKESCRNTGLAFCSLVTLLPGT